MIRAVAALVLALAVLSGTPALGVLPSRARLEVPSALVDGDGLESLKLRRGASRDRTRPGKARRRERQAAHR